MDRLTVGLPVVDDLIDRINLALAWHREYRRVSTELGAYSRHELSSDLRLSPSDIPDLASRAADERVADLARAQARQPRAGGSRLAPAGA
jgi:uncharacterized protein YjiS (DUF1127 family)